MIGQCGKVVSSDVSLEHVVGLRPAVPHVAEILKKTRTDFHCILKSVAVQN